MAKIQSRRTISINRDVYIQALARSAETGEPMSQIVERLLREELVRPPVDWNPPTSPQRAAAERLRCARGKSRGELAAEHADSTGCTFKEAAAAFGVHPQTVWRAAKRSGVCRNRMAGSPASGAPCRWSAVPLFIEGRSRSVSAANDVIRGMTVADAAAKHGVRTTSVYATFRCPPISAINQDAA